MHMLIIKMLVFVMNTFTGMNLYSNVLYIAKMVIIRMMKQDLAYRAQVIVFHVQTVLIAIFARAIFI